jgi:hypothetical protein
MEKPGGSLSRARAVGVLDVSGPGPFSLATLSPEQACHLLVQKWMLHSRQEGEGSRGSRTFSGAPCRHLFMSHWLELSHETTTNCKGGWERGVLAGHLPP